MQKEKTMKKRKELELENSAYSITVKNLELELNKAHKLKWDFLIMGAALGCIVTGALIYIGS